MKSLLPEVIQATVLISLVVFGAIVHATVQLKIARESETEFTKVDFFILTIIAAFAGTIFGMLASLIFQNQIFIGLCAGIGAFLGMAGLNKLANAVLEFLVSRVDKK